MEKLFIQKIARILVIVVIFVVIAVLGYLAGGVVKYKIDIRKADKTVERFQNSLEQPYKEDIYGGKTPEETWAMFLDALRKGDIDLAVKYYAVDKQEKERLDLVDIKNKYQLNNLVDVYSQELRKEDAQYNAMNESRYYIIRDDFNGISDSIIFYRNPYTSIWKIVNL